jgi:hypothetical protein
MCCHQIQYLISYFHAAQAEEKHQKLFSKKDMLLLKKSR